MVMVMDKVTIRVMEQSNVSVQNSSCLDPSNANVNSNIQSDVLNSSVNVGNDSNNALSNDSTVTSNKDSGSGPRVAKPGGTRVKTHASGSSSSPVPSTRARSNRRVQSQKGRPRHISDLTEFGLNDLFYIRPFLFIEEK